MDTIIKTKLSAKTKAIIAVALIGAAGLAFAGFVTLKTTYVAWRQTTKQDFSLGKTTNTVITDDGRIYLQKLQTEKRKIKYITSGSFTTCALFADDMIQCVLNADPSGVKNFSKVEGAKSINTKSLLVTQNIDDVGVEVLLENGKLKYTDKNGVYQDEYSFVDGADLGSVKQLTPNVMHQCVLFDDGHVGCWGDNGQDQLGGGPEYSPYSKYTMPILVKDVENASYVGVGSASTCAVLTNGKVKCWGAFGDSQGNVVKLPIPAEIKNITNASAVTITDTAVFALLNDGTIKYWDDGYGNNIKSLGLTGVKAISAGGWGGEIGGSGYYAACALLSDNTAKCWGNNMVIEKMAGKKVGITEAPVDITDGQGKKIQNISAISIGGYNICTLLTDGSEKCWGGDGPLEANVWPPEEWFDNKYMTSGEYVSMPKTMKGIIKPDFFQAQWAAGEQDGVSLKLQVRTSSTEYGLIKAQWYDLNGTKIGMGGVFKDGWTEDFYPGWGIVNKWAQIKPKDNTAKSWIQYKVIFSSNDDTKSPTLSRMNIDCKGGILKKTVPKLPVVK